MCLDCSLVEGWCSCQSDLFVCLPEAGWFLTPYSATDCKHISEQHKPDGHNVAPILLLCSVSLHCPCEIELASLSSLVCGCVSSCCSPLYLHCIHTCLAGSSLMDSQSQGMQSLGHYQGPSSFTFWLMTWMRKLSTVSVSLQTAPAPR